MVVPPPTAIPNIADRIEHIVRRRDQGDITAEEYERAKNHLLDDEGNIGAPSNASHAMGGKAVPHSSDPAPRFVRARPGGSVFSLPPAPAVEPHWAPDPTRRHQFRYWNGTAWTEHVGDHGVQSTDAGGLRV